MKALVVTYGVKLLLWLLQHPDEVKKAVDVVHAAKVEGK